MATSGDSTAGRRGEPCAGCGSPAASPHEDGGEVVWLCAACAASAELGCP